MTLSCSSWPVRHPRAADFVLAMLALVAGTLLTRWTVTVPDPLPGFSGAWPVAVFAASALSLLFRREAPVLVTVTTIASSIALIPTTAPQGLFPMMIALATLVSRRSVHAGWIAGASAWVLLVVTGALVGRALGNAVPLLFELGLAVMTGVAIAVRRKYIGTLVERAERLERDRDREVQLAASSERTRIAREMHDIVGHGLTVMVRLADGADAARASDPDRAHEAVRKVAELGRDSLADMRRLLGVLRMDDVVGAPRLGRPSLDELVEEYRAAGLPVTLQVSGALPHHDALRMALHRVVQEALTNALRHAEAPTTVEVRVHTSPDAVTSVTVTDDGRATAGIPSPGPERGIAGMRTRAAMFGGSVHAGPVPTGGWQIHATFPTGP